MSVLTVPVKDIIQRHGDIPRRDFKDVLLLQRQTIKHCE